MRVPKGRTSCPWPPWPPSPPRDDRRMPAAHPACTRSAHCACTCISKHAHMQCTCGARRQGGNQRAKASVVLSVLCQGWQPAYRFCLPTHGSPPKRSSLTTNMHVVCPRHRSSSTICHKARRGVRHAACGVRRAARGVRRAACGVGCVACNVRRARAALRREECANVASARCEVRGARARPPTSSHGTSKWSGSRRCCSRRSGRWACRTTRRRPEWGIGTLGHSRRL